MSEFVDAIDPKLFEPYLDRSLKCGIDLLHTAKEDQPDIRAVCYKLFGTAAKVSFNHLSQYMDIIMPFVLKSLDNSLVVENSFNVQVREHYLIFILIVNCNYLYLLKYFVIYLKD